MDSIREKVARALSNSPKAIAYRELVRSQPRITDVEQLKKIYSFDFEAGKIFWKPDPSKSSIFNKRYAGKEAFTATNVYGYKCGNVNGHKFVAHRVLFAVYNGYWPEQVDHINRNRADNRISNLRASTTSENMRNRSLNANNSSGHNGVYWHKLNKKWHASIRYDGKRKTLGAFKTIEDAVNAQQIEAKRHNNLNGQNPSEGNGHA